MIRNEFSEFQEEVETRFFTNKTKIIFDPRPREKRIVRPLQDHYKTTTSPRRPQYYKNVYKTTAKRLQDHKEVYKTSLQDHNFYKTIKSFARPLQLL